MGKKGLKYALAFLTSAVFLQVVFGAWSPREAAGRGRQIDAKSIPSLPQDTVRKRSAAFETQQLIRQNSLSAGNVQNISTTVQSQSSANQERAAFTTPVPPVNAIQTPVLDGFPIDTTARPAPAQPRIPDSLRRDTLPISNFLEKPISGKNKDSLKYNPRDRKVYIYRDGDVTYDKMNLKADFIQVTMDTKEIYAHGYTDSLGVKTRPVFVEGGNNYTMDTIAYNITSEKAKIKGVVTQEGDGILHGDNIKKMPDNVVHIKDGKYTTCDHEHPHFYLAISQGVMIPNNKVIVGFSQMVLEDVPLPIFIPEGFFPLTDKRSSGILVPNFGEESTRGFYFRDGGYYFALGDHIDLKLLGSLYTKGSWELKAESNYVKRYKFTGNLRAEYSKFITGDKGMTDYRNEDSYKVVWRHALDSKAMPGTSFSADVNFETSGYRQTAALDVGDYIQATTSSNIAYGKNWAGTPFSMTASLRLSQSRKDSTYTFNFPTIGFNMTRINPFKRKEAVGKELWYEKIAMTYNANLDNRVVVKEDDVFKEQMFRDMSYGVKHAISAQAPFTILGNINFTPSVNYNENWYFKKVEKEWDYAQQQQVELDPQYGFYRVFNYSANAQLSTKIYGDWISKKKTAYLQQVRHTLTPTIGFSWAPDFGSDRYGFYQYVQRDATGTVEKYSPYSGIYSVPTGGKNGSITFGLSQTLEAKVLDDSDSTGRRKIKFIDEFAFTGSYNLLAEQFKLSNINLRLRMTIPFLKDFTLNLQAVLDPYLVITEDGVRKRVDKIAWGAGKIGRIVSTGWSFDYTFNGGREAAPGSINDPHSYGPLDDLMDPFNFDPNNPIDPLMRREMMTKAYYDFSVPWSLTFSYSVSYSDNLTSKTISQSLRFQGSFKLTPKWGINVSSFTLDLDTMKFTPGSFTLTRNLHCWQMSFGWTPFGARKQWNFSISVLSSMLKDLKYDKSSSYHDNIYYQTAGR